MATSTLDALKGVNAYPIPLRTLVESGERRGLNLEDEATKEVLESSAFRLAIADLYYWLAGAPNVSQGGQSFSFTDEQRKDFRNRARKIWDELEDAEVDTSGLYGYKGDRI